MVIYANMYNTIHKVYETNGKYTSPRLRKNITSTIQVLLGIFPYICTLRTDYIIEEPSAS